MQHEHKMSLPEPDAASAAHSERVAAFIRDCIETAGGCISFAEFMQHALYAPGLGYYTAGSAKFGPAGDFVTAPEISALYGRVLARQCAEILAEVNDGSILEFGAGSGKLAVDVLRALGELDALPASYEILEVSADLRERQEQLLRREVPEYVDCCNWVEEIPQDHSGVVIANEVLDALPVERFACRADGVQQLCVGTTGDAFAFVERPAPAHLVEAVAKIELDLGHALPMDYVSEISLGTERWIGDIAAGLRRGVVLFMDYGVSRREYYARERWAGWLRCHFRHHVHSDPLLWPGIQDLTAWVDFSAVADAAVNSGFDILGYVAQAQFLLNGGIDREFKDFPGLSSKEQAELSGQIKLLTLPEEMGENFKCIGLGRGVATTPSAFAFADRTAHL